MFVKLPRRKYEPLKFRKRFDVLKEPTVGMYLCMTPVQVYYIGIPTYLYHTWWWNNLTNTPQRQGICIFDRNKLLLLQWQGRQPSMHAHTKTDCAKNDLINLLKLPWGVDVENNETDNGNNNVKDCVHPENIHIDIPIINPKIIKLTSIWYMYWFDILVLTPHLTSCHLQRSSYPGENNWWGWCR